MHTPKLTSRLVLEGLEALSLQEPAWPAAGFLVAFSPFRSHRADWPVQDPFGKETTGWVPEGGGGGRCLASTLNEARDGRALRT